MEIEDFMSVEKEYKYMIQRDKYELLERKYDEISEHIEQRNFYYDTLDFSLDKRGITLRCRVIKKKYYLQLKIKKHSEGTETYRTSFEYTKEVKYLFDFIEMAQLIDWFPTLEEIFKVMKKEKLIKLGCLITQRTVIEKEGVKLCIDRNMYLDQEDFEVEIEFGEKDFEYASFLRDSLNLENLSKFGKKKRFLESFKKKYNCNID